MTAENLNSSKVKVNNFACSAKMSSRSAMARVCRKCRVHGQNSMLKGHKGRCIYPNCSCAMCSVIDRRNNLQKAVYINGFDTADESI